MTLFFIFAMGGYFILLIAFYVGWKRTLSPSVGNSGEENKSISIVIPYRNEAGTIPILLDSLRRLDYPDNKLEVIWVNDHSEDGSETLLKKMGGENGLFKLLALSAGVYGKKQAITLGVQQATGEVIAITDADCKVPRLWLKRINQAFGQEDVKLVFGGVRMEDGQSFFSRLQAMEFAGLVGSAVSTLGLGFFSMCNGANLAFLKSAFTAVDGYEGNMQIPSGDDEFLGRKIAQAYPRPIRFLAFADAVVTTRPLPTGYDFMQQRIRWAGKWKYNQSAATRFLAFSVFVSQLAFVGLAGAALLGGIGWIQALALWGIKIILEAVYLTSVGRFLNSTWRWALFAVLQFIYPLYVLTTVVLSQTGAYHWKGRKLSHKI